ncbi:hypothetical protein [Thermoleptolyngbya sp.]
MLKSQISAFAASRRCQSPLPVIAAITEATWFSRTRLACNQLAINLQPTADAQPTSRFPT